MEMILKILAGLIVAAGALVVGAIVGTVAGTAFGLTGVAMGALQCFVAGCSLAQVVNVMTEE